MRWMRVRLIKNQHLFTEKRRLLHKENKQTNKQNKELIKTQCTLNNCFLEKKISNLSNLHVLPIRMFGWTGRWEPCSCLSRLKVLASIQSWVKIFNMSPAPAELCSRVGGNSWSAPPLFMFFSCRKVPDCTYGILRTFFALCPKHSDQNWENSFWVHCTLSLESVTEWLKVQVTGVLKFFKI